MIGFNMFGHNLRILVIVFQSEGVLSEDYDISNFGMFRHVFETVVPLEALAKSKVYRFMK